MCIDPDPVCPERLDPDPVNIRPDPQPCLQALYLKRIMTLAEYKQRRARIVKVSMCVCVCECVNVCVCVSAYWSPMYLL